MTGGGPVRGRGLGATERRIGDGRGAVRGWDRGGGEIAGDGGAPTEWMWRESRINSEILLVEGGD